MQKIKILLKGVAWLIGLLILIFLLRYPKDSDQLIWKEIVSPLAGKIIVLDPGHGGQDGGAVADDHEQTEEKTITLLVAQSLQGYLEQAGAIVYLTRETDRDLADPYLRGFSNRKSQDIRRRLQLIHEKEPDFFLSLHLNSLASSRWRGAQTFYYPSMEENKQLATNIQTEIIHQLENTNRTPLPIHHIYLLKHAKVPGVLVEIGFLSNREERELLKQPSYQEQMAASIYKGLLRYASEQKEVEKSSVDK